MIYLDKSISVGDSVILDKGMQEEQKVKVVFISKLRMIIVVENNAGEKFDVMADRLSKPSLKLV